MSEKESNYRILKDGTPNPGMIIGGWRGFRDLERPLTELRECVIRDGKTDLADAIADVLAYIEIQAEKDDEAEKKAWEKYNKKRGLK